jgi:glycosyltransferase involved in cell wall biosynthesis
VLQVITRLNIGGASPMVTALCTGLAARGHECRLVVGTLQPGEGSLVPEALAQGIEVTEIPSLRRNPSPLDDLATMRSLRRLFRSWKPDIVMTHMSKAGALGRVVGRATRVPVVHTYHGKGFDVFAGAKKAAALALERVLARLGAGSIVVSDIQRDEFVRLKIDRPDRLRTIRYGLRLEPFFAAPVLRNELRNELGVLDTQAVVGVVGRIVAIKGQDVFIRAVARLKDSAPGLCAVLIGDGDARAEYQRLAKTLGVSDTVKFLGWRRDIPAVLAGMDVLALPTVMDFEGVPVAVIEAMAVGLPVVASDVGGVRDAVVHGETGWIVPPRDAAALAHTLATVLANMEQARKVGAAARSRAASLFGLNRFIDETESYLKELTLR